ncbi:MAG: AEC family transporter [Hyphomicrobiales bacterium]|nr:AEC family transporter [Hyphomicrobiales bacterium]
MLATLNAISPIVLVIALGFALYRTGAMGEDVWSAVETLCFYVLFPALFVRTLALAEFADVALWPLAASLVIMICASSLLLLALRPLLTRSFGFSDAAFTSVFQGSTRWHAFIGLAVVGALFGDAGIAIVAFMIAVTVPLLNAVNVVVLVTWGDSGAATASGMLRQMATNPFIVGCLLGGLLNATSIGLPGPLESATDFLAGGALGLGLLTVGAGLRPIEAAGANSALALGVALRLLAAPAAMFALLTAFGVDGMARIVVVICMAIPAASSSYVLSRRMGGDAPLMAGILTAQTLAAALTLPMVIYVLQQVQGGG